MMFDISPRMRRVLGWSWEPEEPEEPEFECYKCGKPLLAYELYVGPDNGEYCWQCYEAEFAKEDEDA